VLVCLLTVFLLHWFLSGPTILPASFNLTGLLPLLPGFMMMMAADGWFRFSRNPCTSGFCSSCWEPGCYLGRSLRRLPRLS
jgi:hypothetical protein